MSGDVADIDDIAERPAGPRRLLHLHESPPLREIGIRLMKVSQNLIAETLRARIGLASDVPDVDPLAAASGACERTLAAWGVPVEDVIVADGSGLSRYDYLTADALVTVLRRMAQDPRHAAAFEATLPILGVDGTLERRLRGTRAQGRVRAKTGSMSNVRALAGYVTTIAGERLAFAIVANNFKARGVTLDAVTDRALTALVAKDRGRAAATAAVAGGARRPASAARAASRMASAGASSPPPCARSGRPPPLPPKRPTSVRNSAEASRATSLLRATTAIAGRASLTSTAARPGCATMATASALSALPSAPGTEASTARCAPIVSADAASAPARKPASSACRSRCDRRRSRASSCRRPIAVRQLVRQHRQQAARRRHRVAQLAEGGQRAAAADELEARPALEPLPAAHGDGADLAGVRRRACRRRRRRPSRRCR